MKRNISVKITRCLAGFLVIMLLIVACQPTPEEEAVVNKADSSQVSEESNISDIDQEADAQENARLVLQKTYKNGVALKADAPIYGSPENQPSSIPILDITERTLETPEEMEAVIRAIYPTQQLYACMPEYTKEIWEVSIAQVQKRIYRLEAGLPAYEGAPEITENERKTQLYQLRQRLADEEKYYAEAPYEQHNPADYIYNKYDDSRQAHVFLYRNDDQDTYGRIDFSFIDWGNGFSIFTDSPAESTVDQALRGIENPTYPGVFDQDPSFEQAVSAAEDFLKEMKIDYMALSAAHGEGKAYRLYYVRSYEGVHETYVNRFWGANTIQSDGDLIAQKLWGPENLRLTIYDGVVDSISWDNLSSEVQIAEQAQLLPWQEIQNNFEKQMDYLLTASELGDFFAHLGPKEGDTPTLYIDRVEFGYVKLLVRNTKDQYQLVPCWTFFGRDWHESIDTAILTLNAVDGSVIQRDLMY